jgi:hypothetical protein
MTAWIGAHAADIVILLILGGIVAAIIRYLRGNKKKGRSSCGCSCGSCPMSGSCHSKK